MLYKVIQDSGTMRNMWWLQIWKKAFNLGIRVGDDEEAYILEIKLLEIRKN